MMVAATRYKTLGAGDGRAAPYLPGEVPTAPGYRGHAHFWERALSRRHVGRGVVGATAIIAGASTWWPASAAAASGLGPAPKPIPGGTDVSTILPGFPPGSVFHFQFPAFGQEVSTITDFNGFVAAAEIQGTGTATNTVTKATTTLTYDADMRFMQGVYVGADGQTASGTFGFI